jgi:hypothetical protein
MKFSIRAFLLMITGFLVVSEQGWGLPAFARKYSMSCNVCHSPVPFLKPFGNEFAANGYQMKDKEPPRFTLDTGDDRLFLMRELPLALRFDGFARYQPDKSPQSDIQWPFILKILSSGQIAKDVSYFLYFLFNEKGTIAGVEDAFIFLNNVGGSNLDVTVGQYQVSDPIFKRELRPTFEDYQIYTVRPGGTKADLTYDRGITIDYGFSTNTDVLISVLNGNGIGETDAFDNFDSDPYKNFFGHVSQEIGENLQVGVLGYLGKERTDGIVNDFSMVGVDATISWGKFELLGQYLSRSDKNPLFLAAGSESINTSGGFAQLMYSPDLDKSNWYLFLLYNKVDSDIDALKYHTFTGNLSYLLARNLKVMGEYTYDVEHKANGFTVGFMTAF